MKWTPEMIDQARAMRAEGLSFRQIAQKFPGMTRNSVAGVFWRSGVNGVAQRAQRAHIGGRRKEVSWDVRLTEPYAVFKARKQRERMEAGR